DGAGVLPTRAAEDDHLVLARVVPVLHRDLADRGGHRLDGDLEEAPRDVEWITLDALLLERADHAQEGRFAEVAPEREREMSLVDAAEEERHVGERELSGLGVPVTTRAGDGARALGAHGEPEPVEAAERAAAGRHRMHG